MKKSHRFCSFLVGMAFLFSAFLIGAQDIAKKSAVLSKKEKQEVVTKIIERLKNTYVFPDKAELMGKHLKKWMRKKSFSAIKDPEDFAKTITREIHSVFEDRHLRVRVRQPERVQQQNRDPILDSLLQGLKLKKRNMAFRTVKILDGNVGYLDFRGFAPPEEAKNVLASAMTFLENTDAMIIDMRNNGGGSASMVQLVCSYFFDKKVHLNSLYWRRGNRTQEFWTLDKIDGKRRPDVPLFILTAKRTFSAAEEFCYNMLTQKRATLVGEITGGGANPGGIHIINNRFQIFIPNGRAINPITQTNWEWTGVKPHIMVDKEKAYDVAYEKAKIAAKEFEEKYLESAKNNAKRISDAIAQTEEYYQKKQFSEGEEILTKALTWGLENHIINEGLVNQLGYNFMGQKKIDLAIGLFKFNVQSFPKSGNAYDSLGEAYGQKGDFKLAIENYKRSHELDPNNQNALTIIEKFEKKLARQKK